MYEKINSALIEFRKDKPPNIAFTLSDIFEKLDQLTGKDIVQTHKEHFNLVQLVDMNKRMPKFDLEI